MRLRLKTKDGKRIYGSVLKKNESEYEVSYGGKTFTFRVSKNPLGDFVIEDDSGRKYKLCKFYSSEYEIIFQINDSFWPIEILSSENVDEGKDLDVVILKSSFSGSVKKVYVNKGDVVQKGHAVLDLESMKMINTMKSPIDGVVDEVYVSDGKSVVSGEKLLKIRKN